MQGRVPLRERRGAGGDVTAGSEVTEAVPEKTFQLAPKHVPEHPFWQPAAHLLSDSGRIGHWPQIRQRLERRIAPVPAVYALA